MFRGPALRVVLKNTPQIITHDNYTALLLNNYVITLSRSKGRPFQSALLLALNNNASELHHKKYNNKVKQFSCLEGQPL